MNMEEALGQTIQTSERLALIVAKLYDRLNTELAEIRDGMIEQDHARAQLARAVVQVDEKFTSCEHRLAQLETDAALAKP